MAELKTKQTEAPVADFLNSISDDQVREDCWKIAEIMEKATKAKPKMWGTSIVGFGTYTYKYASGREGDWPRIAFAPRKTNITLYITTGFAHYEDLMAKLGRHSRSKGCLHIKRLSDIHLPTLKKLVTDSVNDMKKASQRA